MKNLYPNEIIFKHRKLTKKETKNLEPISFKENKREIENQKIKINLDVPMYGSGIDVDLELTEEENEKSV